jgi:hypothetical protein
MNSQRRFSLPTPEPIRDPAISPMRLKRFNASGCPDVERHFLPLRRVPPFDWRVATAAVGQVQERVAEGREIVAPVWNWHFLSPNQRF